jgi:hypothetical protein
MEGLLRFLSSRRSIVGSLLALGGLALHFVGLVTGPLWLPIVVGLYLAGVLLVPAERGFDLALDAAAGTDEIRRGLDRLVARIRGKVALDIQARVERIRDSILVTLEAEGGRVAGDPTVHLIRQTALDYLPSALSAYLALPRAYAERRPVASGSTPHDVLLGQLDLMDEKMREAADAILAHDSEKLLANGRFLADRFATSSLRIDGGAAVPAPAQPVAAAEAVAAVEVPADPARVDVPVAVPAPGAEGAIEREPAR